LSATSDCLTSSGSVKTPTYELGRGNGKSFSGTGRITDYGGNSCSGGYPLFQLKGSASITLFVAKANWIEGITDTKTLSCNYECDENSDCGTDGYVGNKYCKDGNVFQAYQIHSCLSYSCQSSNEGQLVENCLYGCSNGACIDVSCVNGEEKCIGTTYYTCSANEWVSQGKVIGKCSYSEKFTLSENQLVVMESFYGGSTISRTSTRYPVVSFISILPTIIIDATSNSIMTDKTIYDYLDEGETFTIPTDQTWSLFYVIENNYQLPTICDIVDVKTGQCTSINPGIVTACSEGQFDPSLGLCVIQPESSIVCPEGGRYDTAQKVCIFNPPLQAVCPDESVYNVNTLKCEYTPQTSNVCEADFTYNSAKNKCERYPESEINCPSGYAYDSITDKCLKYPNEIVICPLGTTYNSETDKCEYTPSSTFVCQVGFTYNSATDKCEYKPSQEIICGLGTYNALQNVCIYEPQASAVCNKGVLTNIGNGNYACIYTPETIEKCPTGTTYNSIIDKCEKYPATAFVCESGFTYNSNTEMCEVEVQIVCVQGSYDSTRKACVYSPNMEYLCIDGELTYKNGEAKCTIIPEKSIICPQYWTYNSTTDKCEKYPGLEEEEINMKNILIIIVSTIAGLILISSVVLIVIKSKKKRRK
jgi:hypothetical protein